MNEWNNPLPLDPDSIVRACCMTPPAWRKSADSSGLQPKNEPGGCLPQPYPPPVAECPCEQSIRMICGAYCGIDCSELGAAMQYIYHAMRFEECSSQAAAQLVDIAVCEMRHLQLLGHLLCSLGSAPKFYAPRRAAHGMKDCWWTAQPPAIFYADQLKDALCANIELEKRGIDGYCRMIKQTNDPGIVRLFERILLDEEEHLRIFTALLQRFCG